jgi:hypothetical protein
MFRSNGVDDLGPIRLPKGCTIATTEPADKTRYKVLGKYKSNAEAEKAITSMKEC